MCGLHIYLLVFCQLSLLSFANTILVNLERALFRFIWGKRTSFVRYEICYLYPSDGGLGVPNIETRQHTLRLSFAGRMCVLWKEDAKRAFEALRSVHTEDWKVRRFFSKTSIPSTVNVCILSEFSLTCKHLPDTRLLLSKALYQDDNRGAQYDKGRGLLIVAVGSRDELPQ